MGTDRLSETKNRKAMQGSQTRENAKFEETREYIEEEINIFRGFFLNNNWKSDSSNH